MKKANILIILLFLHLFLGHPVQAQTSENAQPIQIWVITDLHYLSPNLHDQDGEAIQHIRNTSAGKDIDYGAQRMEALITQVQNKKPDYLIVSGDLSLNGEYQSMLDLAAYFEKIEAAGTQVLVIPGNHDMSSGWAREFVGPDFIKTRQVLASDFSSLFDNYGYNQALSLDPDSLSYIYPLDDKTWVAMLDSNIYPEGEGKGAPTTKGRLKPETMVWLEDLLSQAQAQGIRVLPVVHHNTIDHHDKLSRNFTLENAAELRQILANYQIPVTLSGHIHTQNYQTSQANDFQLTDIVTGAFSIAPSYIGMIEWSDQAFTYQASPLDMAAWVKTNSVTDPNLTHYQDYIQAIFDKSSRQMAFAEMIESGWYSDDQPILEEVADYVAMVNLAYFAGRPLTSADYQSFTNLDEIQTLIQTKAYASFKAYLDAIVNNQVDYRQAGPIPWPSADIASLD